MSHANTRKTSPDHRSQPDKITFNLPSRSNRAKNDWPDTNIHIKKSYLADAASRQERTITTELLEIPDEFYETKESSVASTIEINTSYNLTIKRTNKGCIDMEYYFTKGKHERRKCFIYFWQHLYNIVTRAKITKS